MSEDNFTTLYPQRWVPIGLSSNPFTKWLRTCKRQQLATDMQHQVKPKQRSQQLKGAPNLGQSGKQTSASDKNMHAHQFTHRERQKEMSTRKKQHKQVRAADALSPRNVIANRWIYRLLGWLSGSLLSPCPWFCQWCYRHGWPCQSLPPCFRTWWRYDCSSFE